VRVTVLGKSPSWQDAGGACSGYLVQEGEHTLLVDCGNGVFGKLRTQVDYVDVDAVVLSHLHADHFLDLVPFSYALTYAPRQQEADTPVRPALHAPPGARETFRRVTGAWGSDDLIEQAFALAEYAASDEIRVGPLQLRFHRVDHFVECFAIEITSEASRGRFVFGADTGPSDALVRFAQGADILMVEATLMRVEGNGPRGHLTPAEAGDHALRAGVASLVLTHITDELDWDRALDEARTAYRGGIVSVAREGSVFEL
jgi:ribonuclease BN (tRNA processing enzyme)